ncbi:MAG: hypothetical protein AAF416_11690 [Pseudomonadota bacterium]
MEDLLCKAEDGNAEAAYLVGTLHAEGHHLPLDLERAERFLVVAADAGHLKAQHKLGLVLLWNGERGEGEVDRALFWLSSAAAAGHAMSAVVLGKLHEDGLYDVRRDLCLAKIWYAKGADLGLAPPVGHLERLTERAGPRSNCD